MNEDFVWTEPLIKEAILVMITKYNNAYKDDWHGIDKELFDFKQSKQKPLDNKDWVIIEYTYPKYNESVNAVREIKKVKRLSDNEIFTIGDQVDYRFMNKGCSIKVYKFQIINNNMYLVNQDNNLSVNIIDVRKIKQPLFTTQDGKEMYEGDSVCLLSTDNWLTSYPITACKNPFAGNQNQFKYFSSQEAAQEYITINKPILCLKDVKNILEKWKFHNREDDRIDEDYFAVYITPIINELKELVKTKL